MPTCSSAPKAGMSHTLNMSVELLIMRHGKSAWDTGDLDFDRPLAPRGHTAAERMAGWLFDQDLRPDYVISSAAERARTTAQYVIDEFRLDRSQWEFRPDLYHAGPGTWVAELHTHHVDAAPTLLICGHNPTLDMLVEDLSASPPSYTMSGKLMTTAAIAHLRFNGDWSDVSPGSGELIDLVRPRDL